MGPIHRWQLLQTFNLIKGTNEHFMQDVAGRKAGQRS
jgi:hypothetical protein